MGYAKEHRLFITLGALTFAAVGFVIGAFTTNWYADHYAKSDDDINASIAVFLPFWLAWVGLGAYLGNKLCIRFGNAKRNQA